MRRRFLPASVALVGAITAIGCTFEAGDEPLGWKQEELSAPKKAFCKVPVEGRGTKDMETDYLPHVITCENGGANLQALKAQAIAARSVAYYSMMTKGSICDSQGCQVYSCGKQPSELAKRAVRETRGMILSHGGTLTYGFYVAGDSGAKAPSCKDYGGYTSHYVTYNAGKTGKSVTQTSLGYIGPPGFGQNRGCMSQWGARCLENQKKYSHTDILRFYYGSDITVLQTQGDCVPAEKTLKAKAVKKWSSAKRFRGKQAHYIACAEQPLKLGFTFSNVGSATWRDVEKRGKAVGSDVFLVTASGKADKLTGKKRFSLRHNDNDLVRGDRKAKNCADKRGCRKTRFISGGMKAKAPKKPGVYTSRWRLRDYSAAWGKQSQGFGPKVELKVKVVSCELPSAGCGCRVWCTDGSSQKLASTITSNAMCKSVAETACKPAATLKHDYVACQPGGGGGTTSTDPSAPSPPSSPAGGSDGSDWPEPETDPSPGDEPPNSGEPADDEDDSDDDGWESDADGEGEDDDADFAEDGFTGDDADAMHYDAVEYGESCSVAPGRTATSRFGSWASFGVGLAAWWVRRRRRASLSGDVTGVGLAKLRQ